MWFRRKRAPAPLLSDADMAKLNEEIFEEPLSLERLFAIYESVPAATRSEYEWVMDQRMFNRIRWLTLGKSGPGYFDAEFLGYPVHLIGLPIVIEPFAKLAIRERVVA